MTENTTGGSAIRHAITSGLGGIVTALVASYLGLPTEVAVPIGTTVASSILGALFRRFVTK